MSVARRTATIFIYQGDDLETLAELRQAAELAQRLADDVATARAAGVARLGDVGPDPQPAKDEYDAFLDVAAERATEVVVQALGRRRFRDLRLECPPRKVTQVVDGDSREVDHEDDEIFGVNTLTFPDKLLAYVDDASDFRTIVKPEFSTKADLQRFLDDELAEGDFDKVWTQAFYLNTALGADPKSSRYSASPQSSNGTTE